MPSITKAVKATLDVLRDLPVDQKKFNSLIGGNEDNYAILVKNINDDQECTMELKADVIQTISLIRDVYRRIAQGKSRWIPGKTLKQILNNEEVSRSVNTALTDSFFDSLVIKGKYERVSTNEIIVEEPVEFLSVKGVQQCQPLRDKNIVQKCSTIFGGDVYVIKPSFKPYYKSEIMLTIQTIDELMHTITSSKIKNSERITLNLWLKDTLVYLSSKNLIVGEQILVHNISKEFRNGKLHICFNVFGLPYVHKVQKKNFIKVFDEFSLLRVNVINNFVTDKEIPVWILLPKD